MEEEPEVTELVEALLSGQGSETTACDVGSEQSKPVRLKKSATYIVCAVIFNDKDEVLMVQEAKHDCYRLWYLPAGRVEVGESLQEALRREVREEAGFECKPLTLLQVEEQGPQWIRFIFLAEVTGGSIKSLSAADHESLQATWWDRSSALPLRGRDILPLIQGGLKYRGTPWHPPTLPVDLSCRHVMLRLLLVFTNVEEQLWVLLVRAPAPHLPTVVALRTHALTWAANMVVQDAMPAAYYDYEVAALGLLGLQHNGRQHGRTDGICLNILGTLLPDHIQRNEDGERLEAEPITRPPLLENSRYVWYQVQREPLRTRLLGRTKEAAAVPVLSLC